MPDLAPSPTIDRLRVLVDGCGLTRSEVAARSGFASPGMLTRALSAGRNPSVDTVRRVLVALGGSWADLDPIG